MKLQDFEGLTVYHITFGQGIIIHTKYNANNDSWYIIIKFNDKTRTMAFPDAFDKWLSIYNKEAQVTINNLLKIKHKEDEEKKKKLEIERLKKFHNMTYTQWSKIKHYEEKIPTYLVFQGKFYEREHNLGVICIDPTNRANNTMFCHNIEELRKNDCIIHVDHKLVKSVSKVLEESFELDSNSLVVELQYFDLENPINIDNYVDIIRNYNETHNHLYSPFNKNGKGNQGYIYPLDLELAKIFFADIINLNPRLGEYKYIQDIKSLIDSKLCEEDL